MATRQIMDTMQTTNLLYGLVIGLHAVLFKLTLVQMCQTKGTDPSFAFHLSYKFEISEPEGWMRSRKQCSIIRTQFLLLWHRVP